jgi:hypothetical protein
VKIPLEPRHIAEFAAFDDAPPKGPLFRFLSGLLHPGDGGVEPDDAAARRGPRIGPTAVEEVMMLDESERGAVGGGGFGSFQARSLVVWAARGLWSRQRGEG